MGQRRPRWAEVLGLGLLAVVLAGATKVALAQPAEKPAAKAKPKANPKSKSKLDVERLKKALDGDESQTLAALDELAQTPADDRQGAAELVNGVLVRGGNVKIVLKALDVAGTLAQPASSVEAAPYVKHRQADVRRAAVRSLSMTGGPEAVTALRAALHGNDAPLRGFAASGLGTLKAKEAVPDLFAVLPRQVPEAAAAIGELCSAAECVKFVDLLGKLPFDLMESGILPIILRVDKDLTDDFKIDVVEKVQKLQTQDAMTLIQTAIAQFPKDGSPKVKVALIAASQNRAVRKKGSP